MAAECEAPFCGGLALEVNRDFVGFMMKLMVPKVEPIQYKGSSLKVEAN